MAEAQKRYWTELHRAAAIRSMLAWETGEYERKRLIRAALMHLRAAGAVRQQYGI